MAAVQLAAARRLRTISLTWLSFFAVLAMKTECAYINTLLPSKTAIAGHQSVTLACSITTDDGTRFNPSHLRWRFNRLVLSNTSKYLLDTAGNTLTINSVNIGDDGEYSCFVIPSTSYNTSYVPGNLTVLVPPSDLTVRGYENRAVVDIQYRADFANLTCVTTGAKPAAELQWLKNGEPMLVNVDPDVVTVNSDGKTFTTSKALHIPQPGRELNKIPFTCIVKQLALDSSLNVSRNLSVYYPPGAPQIKDYQDRVMRPGDALLARCESYDGNPQPSVIWYKNDLPFLHNYVSNEDQKTVYSQLATTVNATDNDAVFRCEVKNDAIPGPLSTQIKLNVKFPPSTVVISGNTKLRAGTNITLTCASSNSNPAASITWTVRNEIIKDATSQVDVSPLGGFVTTSNITVPIVQTDDQVMYTCQATNSLLGQSAFGTALLEVYYPPSKPVIKGYNESTFILYKTVVRLTCTTIGGRPNPELAWYKGTALLPSKPQKIQGSVTASEIEFIAQPNDNKALYKCTAVNEATTPLETSTELKVYFPPQNVTISVEPLPIKEDHQVTFTCDSGVSNPAPVMTWKKDIVSVVGSSEPVTSSAEYGGYISKSRYSMVPRAEDYGVKISCTARNAEIGESMTYGITLDVHHKPYYPPGFVQVIAANIGNNISHNFTARANPAATDYKWYKLPDLTVALAVDTPSFSAAGGYLTVMNIARANAGNYMVVATNSLGSGNLTFAFDIKYAATITNASCGSTPGGSASCVCTADANPVIDNMVTWRGKEGYNMTLGKTQVYAHGVATLTIFDVIRDDIGDFECIADNKLGEPDAKKVKLLAPIRPVIQREMRLSKAALTSNGTSVIQCYIVSYPRPEMVWSHNGVIIGTGQQKYTSAIAELDSYSFRATLTINGGSKSDYGNYTCEAATSRGSDKWSVLLEGTSVPDPPYDIKVLNVTSSSVIISWTPGFEGGLPQHFIVRYRLAKSDARGYNYMDAFDSSNGFEIQKLNPFSTYEITVAGANGLGIGAYQTVGVLATTLVDFSIKAVAEDDVTPIIILTVVIVGLIFLVLNAFLIIVFIRRKRKMMHGENASQANTLELYGTADLSGLNEPDDAKSYTTYEKSVDCDDEYKHYEDDDEDDVRKSSRYGPPPGTYLIDDDLLPPPQPWAKPEAAYYDPRSMLSQQPPSSDGNPTLSPEGYALELRNIGRTLPMAQMTEPHRRSRPSFVAGRPPPPPPPVLMPSPFEDGNTSDAPPIPARHYSIEETLADNLAYQIMSMDRRFEDVGDANMPASPINDDMRGHLV